MFIVFLLFFNLSWSFVKAQHVVDYNAVEKYDEIPQYYIDEVKKMHLNYPGESHSRGLPNGLLLLEQQDSRYAVEVTWTGQPEAPTDQYLRVSKTHWTGSAWATSGGEEDTYTNQAAIEMMNHHFAYVGDILNNNIDAYAFGWCWDMTWHNDPGGGIDPVYQVRWAGSSVGGPEGDLRWGLDDEDTALTGNSVNMQDYLDALAYYEQNNPDTTIIYTTGPVDSSGESGYQRYLKHEATRNWVTNSNGRILFDYSDILAHNNAGELEIRTWTDYGGTLHTFPCEHPENEGEDDPFGYGSGHLSNEGYLKLAKAMWVLLAMKAGWDGCPTVIGDINSDCKIDSYDLAIFADAWFAESGSTNWNDICDLAPSGGDGLVDHKDLAILANGWLQAWNEPPSIISTPVTWATVGQLYTCQIYATGCPITTYTLTDSPAGMTINETTGVIEWTPTTVDDFNVVVEAVNSQGVDTQNFTIVVTQP